MRAVLRRLFGDGRARWLGVVFQQRFAGVEQLAQLVLQWRFRCDAGRGVAEGFDADVLWLRLVPAGRVVTVRPEIEVDLLFVGAYRTKWRLFLRTLPL